MYCLFSSLFWKVGGCMFNQSWPVSSFCDICLPVSRAGSHLDNLTVWESCLLSHLVLSSNTLMLNLPLHTISCCIPLFLPHGKLRCWHDGLHLLLTSFYIIWQQQFLECLPLKVSTDPHMLFEWQFTGYYFHICKKKKNEYNQRLEGCYS